MNTPSQTTKFSAHLSWAGMRRYLQEVLPAEKSQRVEQHLHHCSRCSSAIIDYIRAEEPEHYKEYTKKLKGILKTGQTEKKNLLSSFQMKAIRTTTAVVALLIFSFFALKTVINKQVDYALPSESLAVVEKSEKIAPVRRRTVKKTTTATIKVKTVAEEKPSKRAKVVKKAVNVPQKETPPAEAPTVITKARTAAVPQSAVSAPAQREKSPSEPQPKGADVEPESLAPDTIKKEKTPVSREEVAAAPDNETAIRKPLPTLQKIGASQGAAAVAPLGESNPTEMPMPSNEILER